MSAHCGPNEYLFLSRLIPDWFPSTGNIGRCCRKHDLAYAAGGNELDRARADLRLRACIETRARRRGRTRLGRLLRRRARGYYVAKIYYEAARAYGARHWNYNPPTS